MVKTELTIQEREALIDRLARWANELGIGPLIIFLLECNRPVAPLTGNLLIAIGPMLGMALPIPINNIGLLLMDDDSVSQLRQRLAEQDRKERPTETERPSW